MAVIRSLRARRQARERFLPGFEVVDLNNLQFVRAVKAKKQKGVTAGVIFVVAFDVAVGVTVVITLSVTVGVTFDVTFSLALIAAVSGTFGATFSVIFSGRENRALKSF